ncbi:GNAT family N-acetyltransferase [Altererythrobacter sediminis]|uniref:GNAT family N-acetyltransferase n=2 Tax=Allopontixanthobacter sediminis TaxID=1689985 RepID=A0A845B5U9_9SPHN|nr:GNAT family N-acetyltransferase [Allopontixanthobacter sediminis]
MISVRRLGGNDVAGFRSMNALFAQVFGMPDDYLGAVPPEDYCRRWLADDRNIALLADSGNEVVGALAGYRLDKFEQVRSEVHIYDLAVIETHRRRGAASALIDAVRAIARDAGTWTIFVQADTAPEDEPAIALYRKFASEEITALHFDIVP